MVGHSGQLVGGFVCLGLLGLASGAGQTNKKRVQYGGSTPLLQTLNKTTSVGHTHTISSPVLAHQGLQVIGVVRKPQRT